MEILKNNKNVFWEALIITLFIFGIGILLGVFLENNRTEKISEMYLKSEINLLDIKVQTEILNIIDLDCEQAISKNIEFGDKIYQDAKQLEKYETASRITDSLVQQHRRYDLLRTLFWVNSMKIKQKCPNAFHTVVYLYDYEPEKIEEKSKQQIISNFLSELKQEKANTILLIPIAKNMNLASLDILTEKFNINQTSIIVNEDLVITELEDLYKIKQEINYTQSQ